MICVSCGGQNKVKHETRNFFFTFFCPSGSEGAVSVEGGTIRTQGLLKWQEKNVFKNKKNLDSEALNIIAPGHWKQTLFFSLIYFEIIKKLIK